MLIDWGQTPFFISLRLERFAFPSVIPKLFVILKKSETLKTDKICRLKVVKVNFEIR